MKAKRLARGEWIAMLGGLALGLSLFVHHAYDLSGPNAEINSLQSRNGVASVGLWQVHPIMRWLLLAAAAAPFILAYIILRDHELSWPRGQVTAVVAIAAGGLLFYTGLVDKPGQPSGSISRDWSWYTAFGGALLMLAGSFIRQSETEAVRKPPGVL